MTLYDLMQKGRAQLEEAGIPPAEAALDAELLARQILGWDRARWIVERFNRPPSRFDDHYREFIERRAAREPVAYIRGVQEFFGREFVVSPEVLIPRPETELIVEEALLLLPALGFSRSVEVIDIGTGSGCIAVTLACEFPRARYVATDVSPSALAVAIENARRFAVADRIEFVHDGYFANRQGPFHLVVSNPPYVAEVERDALPNEVRQYEPPIALFAGDNGLREIREILTQAQERLDDDGTILMEIGYGQHERVAEVVEALDELVLVRTRADLQGIPRLAVVRRRR